MIRPPGCFYAGKSTGLYKKIRMGCVCGGWSDAACRFAENGTERCGKKGDKQLPGMVYLVQCSAQKKGAAPAQGTAPKRRKRRNAMEQDQASRAAMISLAASTPEPSARPTEEPGLS